METAYRGYIIVPQRKKEFAITIWNEEQEERITLHITPTKSEAIEHIDYQCGLVASLKYSLTKNPKKGKK
jgi:hypothetical protein